MFETITVSQAIKKGIRTVALPSMLIGAAFIIAVVVLYCNDIVSMPISALIAFVGLFLGWLYWSITVMKWRLWAFENVRNVHELEKKALEGGIIRPEENFWTKTERRTAAQKSQWAALQYKFEKKDVYTEDITVPNETVIYFSRNVIRIQIGFLLGGIALAVYLFIKGSFISGAIFGAGAAYFIYEEYKKATAKEPQIILNDKGLETATSAFCEWKSIEGENIVTRTEGRDSNTYLEYTYRGDAFESINIGELDIDRATLENLLHTYRVRSEKGTGHTTAGRETAI